MSEHTEQVAVCQYLDLLKMKYFAVPNGFKYHGILKMIEKFRTLYNKVKIKIFREVKILKLEGMKSGVPDVFVTEPNKIYHGLFIEMKDIKKGTLSPEQKKWNTDLNDRGYLCVTCHGFLEAQKVIDLYRLNTVR